MVRPMMFAVAVLAVAASSPVLAEGGAGVAVKTGVYDLTSPAGMKALDARLTRAAHHVCDADGVRPLEELRAESRCRDEALARARPQMIAAIERAQRGVALASVSPRDRTR